MISLKLPSLLFPDEKIFALVAIKNKGENLTSFDGVNIVPLKKSHREKKSYGRARRDKDFKWGKKQCQTLWGNFVP